MSVPVAAPTTNWQKSYGWFKGRRCLMIRGSAVLTHGSQFFACPINLPKNSAPVWAMVRNQTAIDVIGGTTTDATNQANGVALCFYPAAATATTPLTTPATGSQSAHTNMIAFVTSTTSNTAETGTVGIYRGKPHGQVLATNVRMENAIAQEALLLLRPANTNSNRVVAASSATNTDSNMVFGTATGANTSWTNNVVHLVMAVEEYDDATSAF